MGVSDRDRAGKRRTQLGETGALRSPQQCAPWRRLLWPGSCGQWGLQVAACGGFMIREDTCHWAPHTATRAPEGSLKAGRAGLS